MRGNAPQICTIYIDQINVGVAAEIAREGDLCTIGRESGLICRGNIEKESQLPYRAALGIHNVKVVACVRLKYDKAAVARDIEIGEFTNVVKTDAGAIRPVRVYRKNFGCVVNIIDKRYFAC